VKFIIVLTELTVYSNLTVNTQDKKLSDKLYYLKKTKKRGSTILFTFTNVVHILKNMKNVSKIS